jgi:tellurite resistance protein TerC
MSSLVVPVWAWALLAVILIIALAIDLVAHRGDHVDSRRRALAWSIAWIVLALGFNLFVALRFGAEAGEQFLAAYLLEKSLSVDNLFVFLVVFGALAIPPAQQRRVLTWGILGAVVMRGALIFAGSAALHRWHAVTYVFGAILLIAALKLLREPPAEGDSKLVHWLERHFTWPRWLIALVAIELTDVVFALDSVPAAFAVSDDPFIIYSSNLFAILGLRALYVVLAGLLAELRFLRFGLAAVLGFAGAKLATARWIHIPPLVSVAIIATVIGAAVVASIIWRSPRVRASPVA